MSYLRMILAAGIAALALAVPATAVAAPQPGSQMITGGGQCTANFLFSDGKNTFLGYAAHCAGTGQATDTDGCSAGSKPLGTPVRIEGARENGTLAYSSWLAMKNKGERDANICAFNDFALVKLAPADARAAKSSMPVFGGPKGVGSATSLSSVVTYGSSKLRAGIKALSPKNGNVVRRTGGGWSYEIYTVTPGIPGDSGSGVLNGKGQALGTLSTVAIAPLPGSNGVAALEKTLAYARANGAPGVKVVDGGPFRNRLLGLL